MTAMVKAMSFWGSTDRSRPKTRASSPRKPPPASPTALASPEIFCQTVMPDLSRPSPSSSPHLLLPPLAPATRLGAIEAASKHAVIPRVPRNVKERSRKPRPRRPMKQGWQSGRTARHLSRHNRRHNGLAPDTGGSAPDGRVGRIPSMRRLPHRLPGRIGVDGEGVDLGGGAVGQQLIGQAVAGQGGLAGGLLRDDEHAEVALAGPGLRTVARVQMGLVDDVESGRPQRLLQALPNGCGNRHVLIDLLQSPPTALSSQGRCSYSRCATASTDWDRALL